MQMLDLKEKLVTGTNRDYTRSIYRCIGYRGFLLALEFVSFDGFVYDKRRHTGVDNIRLAHKKTFREATPDEIYKSANVKSTVNF